MWRAVFTNWDARILLDLEQYFRIDAYDLDRLDRPWLWLRHRIIGLLDIPESRLSMSLDRS